MRIIIGMVLGFVLGVAAHFAFLAGPTTREHSALGRNAVGILR